MQAVEKGVDGTARTLASLWKLTLSEHFVKLSNSSHKRLAYESNGQAFGQKGLLTPGSLNAKATVCGLVGQ